jgi:Holliday junction resolvase RusA-like endonuclease
VKLPYEDSIVYIIDDLNPEPWTAPQGSVGRKGGRFTVRMHSEEQMKNYKDALREALKQDGPVNFGGIDLELHFIFWRQVASYETLAGNRSHAQVADATNLQKASEDALQGLLFDNDRSIRLVSSWIADQSNDVHPRVVIKISPFGSPPQSYTELAAWVGGALDADGARRADPSSNILGPDRGSVF